MDSNYSSNNQPQQYHAQKKKKNPIFIILIILLACGNIALGTLLFLNSKSMNKKLNDKQVAFDDLQSTYDELVKENSQLSTDCDNLKSENEDLQAQIEELTNPGTNLEEDVDSELSDDLNAFVNSNMEDVSMFSSDVSYDDIARHPDEHNGDLLTYSGEVIQVIEGDDTVELRIAVNSNYDDIIYGVYDKRIIDSRILEDDNIQFYGESCGIITYESTLGGMISIPSMSIYKIELK